MTDLVTITVTLEATFAEADTVNVPLDNLAFVGEPWVSTEFAWINGEVTRRKIFRFRARPLVPGQGRVGPLVLLASDGQRQTLPAVAVEIVPDRVSGTNDPEALLRELKATGRPPLFLVGETDKKDVWAGEQLVVTWYLYNGGAAVENWQTVAAPKLPDFWSEEVDVRQIDAERVFVGDGVMQRMPVRRLMLYPLRSGTLRISGPSVEAALMERLRSGPFSLFEGNLIETTFTAAPLMVNVKPLPPGPPIAAVGELSLACTIPQQRDRGPVIVDATLSGAGNLRTATAPRLDGRVAGNVQVEGGSMTSSSRTWRYLIFPAKSGVLEIPALTLTVFSPETGQRKELRCDASTLWKADVSADERRGGLPPPPDARLKPGATSVWPIAAGLLAIVFLGVLAPIVKRELALRRDVNDILSGDIRARIDARVDPAKLMLERSDRGDAYRALRSLLDARDRDRDIAAGAGEEIARRVRDLLRITR